MCGISQGKVGGIRATGQVRCAGCIDGDASGATGSFRVAASPADCSIPAPSASLPWISATTGPSAVTYSVAPNPSSSPRTGALTVAGQTFTITQAGASCSFTLAATTATAPAAGATGSFGVAASPADCSIPAPSTSLPWISATTGPSAVTYSVAPNPSSSPRTGALTVAGQTFTITQAGACVITVASVSSSIPSEGGSVAVAVNTAAECGWIATSNVKWLKITSGASAMGSGSVEFSAAANPEPVLRTGTLNIAGKTHTVSQPPPVGASTEAFVRQLYLDLLSREGEPAGVKAWTELIDTGGLTRQDVAAYFLQSPEFSISGLYIIKLYLAIMLRDPDYAGWTMWFNLLRGGQPRSWILEQFLASQEFQLRYGSLSNSDFVRLTYRNVLEREPDPAGYGQWLAWLNTGSISRAEVMQEFIASPEFDMRVRDLAYANLLYIGFLRRSGESSGIRFWTTYLKSHGLMEVVTGFITSQEFLKRF